MMTGQSPDSGEGGFSLVEMLVAISILALLSGLLLSSLSQIRPLLRITELADSEAEVTAISGYVERLIAGTRALPLLDENTDRKEIFRGGHHSIRFVTISRTASNVSSLREVELFSRQGEDGFDLIQRNLVRRLRAEKHVEEFVIARGLSSIRFRFLEPANASSHTHWKDEWGDTARVPRAVHISLAQKRAASEVLDERYVYLRAAM